MIYLQPTPKPQFPPVEMADEQGFLAFGGRLDPSWIIEAYRRGIFPWFNEDQPYLWFSPHPRMVLQPSLLKVSKSTRRFLKRQAFRITCDTDFKGVIEHCAAVERPGQAGTWITSEMAQVYISLHHMGYAHSFEVYQHDTLIGGMYGLCIGQVFFGESMFSIQPNASKTAFIIAVRWMASSKQISLIDCQIETPHLKSMGAELIDRKTFTDYLQRYCNENFGPESWKRTFSAEELANLIE